MTESLTSTAEYSSLNKADIVKRYQTVRTYTEQLCRNLCPEDYVPQPIADVSPPKWHLAHTTWFFETFILQALDPEYKLFDNRFAFLFNSYYEAAGERILRTHRGNLSRPAVETIYTYRKHVDKAISALIQRENSPRKKLYSLLELGLNHEQQHQELLVTDIKFILGHNPLFPAFAKTLNTALTSQGSEEWVEIPKGVYSIGFKGEGFCFDNELGHHEVLINPCRISKQVVRTSSYLAFMRAGGYEQVQHWLSEGWSFVQALDQHAPLHWHKQGDRWMRYTPEGLIELDMDAPITHLSYYEADAYARWAGFRLVTEFEWEVAHASLDHGQVWEWTSSAYSPYPNFQTAPGALGEYNGKWMVNQQVLRGSSVATSPNHSRPTYRNFFHADKRWQYTGIRLAESV